MDAPLSRRAAIGLVLAAGGGSLLVPQVRWYLDRLAPGSGTIWEDVGPPPSGPISSPYGDATVTVDDDGVPHVVADDERALQFAHGFVQGYDRLFQLDLFRRQLRGQLSAVVGPITIDSDEFHVRLGFAEAAAASERAIAGSAVEPVLEAYVAGVNDARRETNPPLETALLDYEIEPWTVQDTLLVEKLIGWQLTGRFRTLRRIALADAIGVDITDDLHPPRYRHDVPILDSEGRLDRTRPNTPSVPKALVDRLSRFEAPPGVGSNSAVVGGAHTATGGPILANDPHLALTAPPIWYEVGLQTPTFATRGVAFPGSPFVVIGRNRGATWGFTNVPADVIDFYTYERDEERYRIGDDWYPFDRHEATIEVAGEDDRTISIRRTRHGPLFEHDAGEFALSWTGFGGTNTIAALHAMQSATDFETFNAALDAWELPPQNLVYADRDGRTMYRLVGRIPIRRIDGEPVRADRVFDGTAEEGNWEGFEPYEIPSWDGFIDPDDLPRAVDVDWVTTANQRVVDDPLYYHAENYAPPFRAYRIDDRLTAAVEDGSIDVADMWDLMQDVYDPLAAMLVDELNATVEPATAASAAVLEELVEWDKRMAVDSEAAAIFTDLLDRFRTAVFGVPLEEAGFGRDYWPSDWVLATLSPEHPWFDRIGPRAEHLSVAFEGTVEAHERGRTLGDRQTTEIDHPLQVDFLGYPRRPIPGSPRTLKNYRLETAVGAGWQQAVEPGTGQMLGRLAGGNAGRPLSPHYADQLTDWVDGRPKSITFEADAGRIIEFQRDSP